MPTDECQDQLDAYNEAADALEDAHQAVEDAEAVLESEQSAWDESTWGDIAAGAGILAACILPEPFSKAICIAGLLGGGAGIVGSELDRQSDIEGAEAALETARAVEAQAILTLNTAFQSWFLCFLHSIAKGQ